MLEKNSGMPLFVKAGVVVIVALILIGIFQQTPAQTDPPTNPEPTPSETEGEQDTLGDGTYTVLTETLIGGITAVIGLLALCSWIAYGLGKYSGEGFPTHRWRLFIRKRQWLLVAQFQSEDGDNYLVLEQTDDSQPSRPVIVRTAKKIDKPNGAIIEPFADQWLTPEEVTRIYVATR